MKTKQQDDQNSETVVFENRKYSKICRSEASDRNYNNMQNPDLQHDEHLSNHLALSINRKKEGKKSTNKKKCR